MSHFDFSGYADMARGIARVMGFRMMLNFNNPYYPGTKETHCSSGFPACL